MCIIVGICMCLASLQAMAVFRLLMLNFKTLKLYKLFIHLHLNTKRGWHPLLPKLLCVC